MDVAWLAADLVREQHGAEAQAMVGILCDRIPSVRQAISEKDGLRALAPLLSR